MEKNWIVVALAIVASCHTVNSADQPNIILIMADDMGYSDLGCFGGEIRTPQLDQLAQRGLRFTNFYSENMCSVSRASMLTGIYHKTSMVNGGLHPRCMTLADLLQRRGYQTRMSGKWHLAGKQLKQFPNDRGFEQFYGILGGAASFFAPALLHRNRENVEHEAVANKDYYITDAISDEAVRMIQEAGQNKPLFLYVAYTAAHWPLHAREEEISAYRGIYARGWDQLRRSRLARMKSLNILPKDTELSPRHAKIPSWKQVENKAWQQRRMEVYAAQVTCMDRGIGRVVAALQETGRLDNTLVFFTIDNGGCHVEYAPDRKGYYLPAKTRDGRPVKPGNLPTIMPGPEDTYQSYGYGWANASNTPYRMFKQFDHEGGIRTPMIAHWPRGITKQGSLVRAVSHLVDILPTVAEVTGSSVPDKINGKASIRRDGRSLAAAFRNQPLSDERTLFFHHARGRALRHNQWKIVAEQKGNWELYDLAGDPLELRNLATANPTKLSELVGIWELESERLSKQANRK